MSTSGMPLFGQSPYGPSGSNMFGDNFNLSSLPGSNQYFGINPTSTSMPGNTSLSSWPVATTPPAGYNQGGPLTNIPVGSSYGLGKGTGTQTIPTFDPQFTAQFYSWLNSQLGKGATPFGGQVGLPSGGTTAPGQLSAPLNPLEQSLNQFYATGTGGPMPGVLPMWNAAIAAMSGPQGPIAQQEAQLKQQFAFGGDLASSPFAQAMTQFGEQTALNQEALLTQATLQALPTMQQQAATVQGFDQAAIDRALQEFIRTQPEYSPLLNMLFGGATSSPGVFTKSTGTGIGSILGGLGSLLTGGGQLAKLLGLGGAGAAAGSAAAAGDTGAAVDSQAAMDALGLSAGF